jgi:serine/threonine protein phosphatase PrpC/LysM repeat protein
MAKTQDLKNFDFGNSTDIGLVRSENEDYMGYFECINGHVFLVCDGMGGHKGGATASRTAVENIRAYLENHYFDMPEDALKASIEFANSVVFKKSKTDPELAGMGTTIVMIIVRYDKVYYAHVGDSRIYIQSGSKLFPLTRDHSLVQEMVDKGTITPEEALDHPEKNIITRVLGIGPDVDVETGRSFAMPANDDIIVLCSDGLTGMVSDMEIENVLNENISVQHKAMKLTQLANDNGGTDNITVQLILFYNVANKKSKFTDVSGKLTEVKAEKKDRTIVDSEPYEPKPKKEKKPFTMGNKINISALWMKRIKVAAISLGVLLLAYIIWDMFIRQGVTTPMANDQKVVVTDSVKKPTADSVAKKETVVAKTDTNWISYSVKKGEVLGKISSKFGIPVAFIKLKNKLKNDNIGENQKLMIPIKADHAVAKGETADVIAKKYNVPKASILKANDIKDEKTLKAGRDLVIPFK